MAFMISPDVKNEMAKHKCTNLDSLMFVAMVSVCGVVRFYFTSRKIPSSY